MNVIDVNDNAPVFDPSSYDAEVWENATINTSVLTVGATDLDFGECLIVLGHSCGTYNSN
jgi:predicted nuclease of predicted toxin-antitoxin system